MSFGNKFNSLNGGCQGFTVLRFLAIFCAVFRFLANFCAVFRFLIFFRFAVFAEITGGFSFFAEISGGFSVFIFLAVRCFCLNYLRFTVFATITNTYRNKTISYSHGEREDENIHLSI